MPARDRGAVADLGRAFFQGAHHVWTRWRGIYTLVYRALTQALVARK